MSKEDATKNLKKSIISRRQFLRLSSLSAAGLVLAACSGQQATESAPAESSSAEESTGAEEESMAEEESVAEAEPVEEGKEIVWWFAWGNLADAVDTIMELDSFKEHIGNDTLTHKGSTSQEEFLTAFASGEPPDGGSNTDYPGFWARGVVMPVDDLVAGSSLIDLDDMLPALVEGAKYDGQQIGVVGIESYIWWGLNYNAKHVEEAGLDPDNPPLTFEGLLDWHKELTIFDSAGNLERLGLDPYDAMAGEPDFPAFSHGLRWWDEEERTFHLDDERMAEAVDTFGEFYRFAGPDNMAGFRSVEGQGTWGGAYEADVQSMIIEGYWHPGEATINQPKVAENNRATWAPVPADRDGAKIMATGPHYVQLYKDGKNLDGMFKVAEFLHTKEALDIIFNEVGWLTGKLSYLKTVDANAFPGLDFYMDAPDQVDEWLVGRRSPIHWFVAGEWNTLKEQVYRDLMSPSEAVAELQKRAVDEWEAQGLK